MGSWNPPPSGGEDVKLLPEDGPGGPCDEHGPDHSLLPERLDADDQNPFCSVAVWREVVSLTGAQREEFLASVALPRLERLITVAESRARPWTEAHSPA